MSLLAQQNHLSQEIEAVSDNDAREIYGALIWIVHQMLRAKDNLDKPIAVNDAMVLAKTFEKYVERLDLVTSEELQSDYEFAQRNIADRDSSPHLCYGAQALMVIILGEMIRRQCGGDPEQKMSGYQRAYQVLERLERSLGSENA